MSSKKQFIFTSILAISSLLVVSFLWEKNLLLFFILAVLGIAMLLLSKSMTDLALFLFCGVVGMAAESFAISFGAWNYNNSSFFGVPIWLPVLWAIASIYLIRVAEFFKNYDRRRRLLNFFWIRK